MPWYFTIFLITVFHKYLHTVTILPELFVAYFKNHSFDMAGNITVNKS